MHVAFFYWVVSTLKAVVQTQVVEAQQGGVQVVDGIVSDVEAQFVVLTWTCPDLILPPASHTL